MSKQFNGILLGTVFDGEGAAAVAVSLFTGEQKQVVVIPVAYARDVFFQLAEILEQLGAIGQGDEIDQFIDDQEKVH